MQVFKVPALLVSVTEVRVSPGFFQGNLRLQPRVYVIGLQKSGVTATTLKLNILVTNAPPDLCSEFQNFCSNRLVVSFARRTSSLGNKATGPGYLLISTDGTLQKGP